MYKKDTMANKVKSMLQIRRILQLLEAGRSKRFISRELGVSRNTVDYYARKVKLSGLSLGQLLSLRDGELSQFTYNPVTTQTSCSRAEHYESQTDYFLKELTRVGVTRQLLWEEYKANYPDGYGYSQFCERLTHGKSLRNVVMHLDHRPGERMEIDFAGKKLSIIDPLSKISIECPVLVCILPYSGLTYVEALPDASQWHVYNALSRAFRYIGGVTQSILSDNMRQYVIKSNRYEPTFNELAEQFSVYYNTSLTATRVVKPRDKASVEKQVSTTYQRIFAPLRNVEYFSLNALNNAVYECLEAHNNKPMQKTGLTRRQRFDSEEKLNLKPLPVSDFVVRHKTKAKVQRNYHVLLGEDMHQYSVPYIHVGKQVQIVYDHHEVEIFLDMQRIALHKRDARRNGYSTKDEHMPQKHLQYKESKGWDAEYFLTQGLKAGINTKAVMARLLGKSQFPEQTYNACLGILSLGKKYGNERLESACKMAMSVPATNYKMVANILKNNRDMACDEQENLLFKIPVHENVRGKNAFE